jgi:hypothetical protein
MMGEEPFALADSDYRFTQWPVPLSPDDYSLAIERYLSRITKVDGLRAVYQFGSMAVPGLSDIDLIVVLDDSISSEAAQFKLQKSDNPSGKEAFLHNPVFLNRRTWENLHWVFAPQNLQRVYGETLLEPVDIPSDAYPYIAVAVGIEYAVRQLHWLALMDVQREIPIRGAISIAQSATYLGEMATQAGCSKLADNFVALKESCNHLRTSWFVNPDPASLLSLLAKTVTLVVHFNKAISEGPLRFFDGISDQSPKRFLHSRQAISYFAHCGDCEAVSVRGEHGRWLGQDLSLSVVRLPKAYGLHYVACAAASSEAGYGPLIHRALGVKHGEPEWLGNLPNAYIDAMRRRMMVADTQLLFLHQHRLGCGYLIDCGVFDIPVWRGWRALIRDFPKMGFQYIFRRYHLSRWDASSGSHVGTVQS